MGNTQVVKSGLTLGFANPETGLPVAQVQMFFQRLPVWEAMEPRLPSKPARPPPPTALHMGGLAPGLQEIAQPWPVPCGPHLPPGHSPLLLGHSPYVPGAS